MAKWRKCSVDDDIPSLYHLESDLPPSRPPHPVKLYLCMTMIGFVLRSNNTPLVWDSNIKTKQTYTTKNAGLRRMATTQHRPNTQQQLGFCRSRGCCSKMGCLFYGAAGNRSTSVSTFLLVGHFFFRDFYYWTKGTGVIMMLWWCYDGVVMMLWWYDDVMMMLEWC